MSLCRESFLVEGYYGTEILVSFTRIRSRSRYISDIVRRRSCDLHLMSLRSGVGVS